MSQCSTGGPDPLETGTGPPRKRCLIIAEWCKVYGLSRSSFYNLVASGELKAIRLGGRTLARRRADRPPYLGIVPTESFIHGNNC